MSRDELLWIDNEPADMAAAIRAARETFDEFRRCVELENFHIVPAFSAILVKVMVADEHTGAGEHVFLSEPVISADTITGDLASQPQVVGGMQPGESVTVGHSRLTDWFLICGDEGVGGFTVEVLRAQIPPCDLPEYTAHPPVSWYNHRTRPAIEELRSIPACSRCGQQDLVQPSYVDGVCSLCTNGGTRTSCPICGVPLFRYPGAPPECHACLATEAVSSSEEPSDGASSKKWWQFWK